MPDPAIAISGLGLASAGVQARAARRAGNAQAASADAAIAEQRYQFDEIQRMLAPYVGAGNTGLQAQLDLMGVGGGGNVGAQEAQRRAIQGIEQGPEFGAMVQQGENALLQNASATGGLRGGNTQAALAQFRPQVLNQLINQQLSRFGGLTQLGQSSAAMQASAGQASASNIGMLLQQQGAAQAGASFASGRAFGNVLGGVGGLIGENFGTSFTGGFNLGANASGGTGSFGLPNPF